MKATLLSATLVTLGLLIGCGQSSTSNEPDANGSWNISFTPPLSAGIPTSSGVTLVVAFVQTAFFSLAVLLQNAHDPSCLILQLTESRNSDAVLLALD